MKDIVHLSERAAGQPLALATLVRVRGSSYRRPGARMLIRADGVTAGSLSAGCIEEEIVLRSREVVRSGAPELISFDTRRRFGCDGSIGILLEPADAECLHGLRDQFRERRSCTLRTVFESADEILGTRVLQPAHAGQRDGVFVQTIDPVIRLLVIGEGPDAPALSGQAALLGWDCVCVDSIQAWTESVDSRTAAVIATHNYGRDCAALRHLLPLGLNYLGLIGPRRRRDQMFADIMESGTAIASEFFAPAGLDLGADSTAEIALSIVAEIQSVFAGGSTARLRDRREPIHRPASISRERAVACVAPAR